MKKEGEQILEQIIKSLEEASVILDEFYKKRDFQKFNRAKSLILQLQKNISEIIP